MNDARTLVLVVAVTAALWAAPLSAAGAAPAPPSVAQDDEPTTNGTVGYVEGYWHDDELEVDGTDRTALSEDELEAVVYRSMARVEVIRERTFEDEVDVDVVSREAFEGDSNDLFAGSDPDERLAQNVRYEALFMVDRETDAGEEYEALYGDAVGGYYDPVTERIVLVSDAPDEPEVDEVILGHELVHALQDQHFDLQRYDKDTRDQAAAKDGLIEGDAVRVERAYEERCGEEWDCVLGGAAADEPAPFHTGLFLIVIQPYTDGPDYVDHLREEGGWDAVDAAYDDPPASAAEVIRPGDDREPVDIEHEDRSNDRWEPLETGGGDRASFGEVGLAAMFMYPTLEVREEVVLETDAVYADNGIRYDYDHEVTDGWAGDRLVTYATDERTVEESAYVWETEWLDEGHAEEFLAGYLALLDHHGADPVEGRQDTYEIAGDDFPGAYAIEHDGESVTIVRAPAVDDLSDVRTGAGEAGEDEIDDDVGEDGDDETNGVGGLDRLSGFGAGVAAVAVLALALLAARRAP